MTTGGAAAEVCDKAQVYYHYPMEQVLRWCFEPRSAGGACSANSFMGSPGLHLPCGPDLLCSVVVPSIPALSTSSAQ
jgi:hypothetical protein